MGMELGAERREYPSLDGLLGGWFHQDFDLEGDDFREIVRKYRGTVSAEVANAAAGDIERFLERYGESDAGLNEAVERVFAPQVILEGWDGLTTREWLLAVVGVLRGS